MVVDATADAVLAAVALAISCDDGGGGALICAVCSCSESTAKPSTTQHTGGAAGMT